MRPEIIAMINKNCQKIISALKAHGWVIIFSFLLAVLIFAPLLAFPWAAGSLYQGININHFGNDAHFYLTRGNEVLSGNSLGSPLLREGKNDPDAYLSYSDYLLLAPVKLSGLEKKFNIVTIYNFYNFIGVFVLIILIYFFVLQLSGDKLLSLTAALFVIGGYSIIYFKTFFYHDFNAYARVLYPYLSSLVLFTYLNLLVKCLKSAELRYKIFAGLAFGLLFYIYFYAWSFVLAFNACLLLIFIFKKDFLPAKTVCLISALGLALGAYNLIKLFSALGGGIGAQLSYFMHLSLGHTPVFSKVGFITLILFALFWQRRRQDQYLPLILAVILSGWAALNQQTITGKMLQYGHYYWYFIVPLSIVVSFYMVWRLLASEKLKKILFIVLIAVVFINTAGGQYLSFFSSYEAKIYEQNFQPIIDFLNRDLAPAAILAGQENSYLFTIYTPHDLFWLNAAALSYLPIQRFKDALFVYAFLNKEARNNFTEYFTRAGDDGVGSSFYRALYRDLASYYEYANKAADNKTSYQGPQALADQLSQEYNDAVIKNDGIDGLLEKYGVSYIVWDKNLDPEWDLSFFGDRLKEITSFNNIYLYRL